MPVILECLTSLCDLFEQLGATAINRAEAVCKSNVVGIRERPGYLVDPKMAVSTGEFLAHLSVFIYLYSMPSIPPPIEPLIVTTADLFDKIHRFVKTTDCKILGALQTLCTKKLQNIFVFPYLQT